MDSEAVVIRSEMSQTRAALDQKIAALEARAHEMSPAAYARRHMPEYAAEKIIGSLLLLVGLKLAWAGYRRQSNRRAQMQAAFTNAVSW